MKIRHSAGHTTGHIFGGQNIDTLSQVKLHELHGVVWFASAAELYWDWAREMSAIYEYISPWLHPNSSQPIRRVIASKYSILHPEKKVNTTTHLFNVADWQELSLSMSVSYRTNGCLLEGDSPVEPRSQSINQAIAFLFCKKRKSYWK